MPKNGFDIYIASHNLKFLILSLLMLSLRRIASLSTSNMPSSSRTPTAASSTQSAAKHLHFHWFRQDLRLHDNPALVKSIKNANAAPSPEGADISTKGIIPIYCFDPRFVGGNTMTPFGSLKCGAMRAKFLLESVTDLRNNLEKKGSGLLVAYGKTEDVISQLCKALENELASDHEQKVGHDKVQLIPHVVVQDEPASEECNVDRSVRRAVQTFRAGAASGSLETVWAATLYDINDLPFHNGVQGMPDTFTPFRNKVEKHCKIPSPLPAPSKSQLAMPQNESILSVLKGISLNNSVPNCSLSYLPTLSDLGYSPEEIEQANHPDPRGVMTFQGGETAGLKRIQEYIFDKDLLKIYFDTRNGMLGADYSTKFSPWLAHGCISPRFIAQECKRYETETGIVNKSTYWVVFELLWGCFFRMFALKHGNQIFFLDGTLGKEAHGHHPNSRRWGLNPKHLQAWKDGLTGYPLVDANMRELKASGFMSNRGRQNVASFLAIDMSTDWRYGADHFESLLLDHDVYANWGNWCSAAGMTGGRLNRFNIVKQSKDYDKEGDYVRHWCPELANVPTKYIHEPWKLSKDQQKEYGVRLGVDYPNPIIPPTYNSSSSSSGGGYDNPAAPKNNKGGRHGKRDDFNPNRGRGQRKDMKSLKQGSYQFRDLNDAY